MKYLLEICADSIESAINAQNAGADRIELCDNLTEGGTTPSFGKIAIVRENLNIDLNVLIRPRGGDFLYSEHEIEIMKRDILKCRELNVNGIVIGILKSNGQIDKDQTARLVDLAYPMSVTFHRAFDLCTDAQESLEDIIEAGAARLLTSGQKNTAEEGADLIKALVERSYSRMVIMPGGGISEYNIEQIAKITGSAEFHLTGRKVVGSNMTFRREGLSLGAPGVSEYSRKVADPDLIERIIHILNIV